MRTPSMRATEGIDFYSILSKSTDGMSEKLLSSIIDYLYIEGKEDIIY